MKYAPKEFALKSGKVCAIRRAEGADAEQMLRYQRATSGETPYLMREAEEITRDVGEERDVLCRMAGSGRELMLYAEVDGRHAGCCSFVPVRERNRVLHRCTVGISIYREFWGMGVGTALMGEALAAAQRAGYEQAELDVASANAPAIALYKKLGFETTGTIPHALKYRDGSYADFLLMIKPLL